MKAFAEQFGELYQSIEGLNPGDVLLVAARPGMGVTPLLSQICHNSYCETVHLYKTRAKEKSVSKKQALIRQILTEDKPECLVIKLDAPRISVGKICSLLHHIRKWMDSSKTSVIVKYYLPRRLERRGHPVPEEEDIPDRLMAAVDKAMLVYRPAYYDGIFFDQPWEEDTYVFVVKTPSGYTDKLLLDYHPLEMRFSTHDTHRLPVEEEEYDSDDDEGYGGYASVKPDIVIK